MKKLCFFLGVLLLTSCFGNNRGNSQATYDATEDAEYEYEYEYETSESEQYVHYHDADCVNIYCENDYFYKKIHIQNICSETIKKVTVYYVTVPENPMNPGVNTISEYRLDPGETGTSTLTCNGYEVAVIIQDIVIE